MDNDRFDLYDRNAETSRVSAFAPRIRFVNYRGLAGMELPVWGRRRLIDYELILPLHLGEVTRSCKARRHLRGFTHHSSCFLFYL